MIIIIIIFIIFILIWFGKFSNNIKLGRFPIGKIINQKIINQIIDEELTILTYNVGLLDYKIFGITLFSNPKYSKERLPYIIDALYNQNAIIIAIQECYNTIHSTEIIQKLKKKYPYYSKCESGGILSITNGLLVLSKYPIVLEKLLEFKAISWFEYWFASKSCLIVTLKTNNLGNITIFNTHTTSGDINHPKDSIVNTYRQQSLDEIISQVRESEKRLEKCIIVGDLNCGPESSLCNYNYLLKQKFRDIFVEYNNVKEYNVDKITWDPKNYLNYTNIYSNCSPQRIDHLLFSNYGWECYKATYVKILFNNEIVPIFNNQKCTMSDHYGVFFIINHNDNIINHNANIINHNAK